MRKIPLNAGLLTFLDDLEYVEAALSADVDAKDLAAPYQDEIQAWETVFKKERLGRRNVVRAEAVVAVRNAHLDDKTTRFGASALGEAGGNRKAPFFRRFFPIAPSQFVRRPLRKQCEETLHVVTAELEKLDASHPLRAYITPLTTLATAALDALDSRNKAKAERTTSNNDVDEWKEGVNTLRLSTYAELLKIAAEKGYPRSWADAFFPSEDGAPTESPDPAAPEAAGGAAGDKPKTP